MQEPLHYLFNASFEPNLQDKEEANFAVLTRFKECSAGSRDMAAPIKLKGKAVPFATLASTLQSDQVQHIRMEAEILPQSALLPYWTESRQWRPIKLEDGDLARSISFHSEPQAHQVEDMKVEKTILPSRVPKSRLKPHIGFSHKRSLNRPANDSSLRNEPSGIGKKGDSKQHLRKRFPRFEEKRSLCQRKRTTDQMAPRRFVREGAP